VLLLPPNPNDNVIKDSRLLRILEADGDNFTTLNIKTVTIAPISTRRLTGHFTNKAKTAEINNGRKKHAAKSDNFPVNQL
jgi:hypothetical protein